MAIVHIFMICYDELWLTIDYSSNCTMIYNCTIVIYNSDYSCEIIAIALVKLELKALKTNLLIDWHDLSNQIFLDGDTSDTFGGIIVF